MKRKFKLNFEYDEAGQVKAVKMFHRGKLEKTVPMGIVIGEGEIRVPPGQEARIWDESLVEHTKGKKYREGLCVVRVGGIGDLIILGSSIRKMKAENPDRRLTLATKKEHLPLFKGVNYLNAVVPIVPHLERNFYDEFLDLRWRAEPKQVGGFGRGNWRDYRERDRSDVFDKLCAVKGKEKNFKIPVAVPAAKRVNNLIPLHYPTIAIAATGTSPVRSIPPDLIKPLHYHLCGELNAQIVFLGNTGSKYLETMQGTRTLNLINKLDLEEFIAACYLSDLIIAPDSAAVHIGGALNLPTLGLFGNIDPKTRVRYYKTVQTIYTGQEINKKGCPCWDCWRVWQNCQKECLSAITPERIVEKVRGMLCLKDTKEPAQSRT